MVQHDCSSHYPQTYHAVKHSERLMLTDQRNFVYIAQNLASATTVGEARYLYDSRYLYSLNAIHVAWNALIIFESVYIVLG